MSSKDIILENLKKNAGQKYDMPDLDNFQAIQYDDLITQFVEISKAVGGNAVVLKEGDDINEVIKSLYPDAKTVASNLKDINFATINPDEVEKPHDLNGTDLGIVEGAFGVCENGCVWIPQTVKEKVIYFISEQLVIVIDKQNLVNNMYEAYQRIQFNDKGFGLFISGPSKTADIEQSLVVGAHGPKGSTVILR